MNQDSSASILQNGEMFDRQTKKILEVKAQLKAWYGPYCTDMNRDHTVQEGEKDKRKT